MSEDKSTKIRMPKEYENILTKPIPINPVEWFEVKEELAQLKDLNREMVEALRLCIKLFEGGKQIINDDNGETELILETGDEWVAIWIQTEEVLTKTEEVEGNE